MSNPSKTSAPAAPTADERLAAVEKRLAVVERRTNDAARAASEAVWAQVFHDTIRGSAWLMNQTFDFISIDGPLSGDMKELGRVDGKTIHCCRV